MYFNELTFKDGSISKYALITKLYYDSLIQRLRLTRNTKIRNYYLLPIFKNFQNIFLHSPIIRSKTRKRSAASSGTSARCTGGESLTQGS